MNPTRHTFNSADYWKTEPMQPDLPALSALLTPHLQALRPAPGAENAIDATDRLLIDEFAATLRLGISPADADSPATMWRSPADSIPTSSVPSKVAVLNDTSGALTAGLRMLLPASTEIATFQDSFVAGRVLHDNLSRVGVDPDSVMTCATLGEAVSGADVVVDKLEKSLDVLAHVSRETACGANPTVTLLLGGRLKYMTATMNTILAQNFGGVTARYARQKSRVLIASEPLPEPAVPAQSDAKLVDLPAPLAPLMVHADPGAFAGAKLDLGTRVLLQAIATAFAEASDRRSAMTTASSVVDLGCGTGVLAVAYARLNAAAQIIATDESVAAINSTSQSARAAGVSDQVQPLWDDAGLSIPANSVDLVLCNPPFHQGTTITTGTARHMFASAARMLRPGGEIWTVYNGHLGYKPMLESDIGSTRIMLHTDKFVVTRSRKR